MTAWRITGHSLRVREEVVPVRRFGVVPTRKSLRPTAYAIRASEQQEARRQHKRGEASVTNVHVSRKPFLKRACIVKSADLSCSCVNKGQKGHS